MNFIERLAELGTKYDPILKAKREEVESELARRGFIKLVGFGTVALTTVGLESCNIGGIWSQIQVWVPVGIAAFEQVLALVAPLAAPGIDAIAELVKAGFAALASAVNQYINAPAADKITLKAKVLLIFSQLSGDIQSFLNAVKVEGTNPIVKVILGLVGIILSTISGFISQIGPTPAPASLRLGGASVQVVPVKRSLKQFKSDFNAALVDAGHPELQIH